MGLSVSNNYHNSDYNYLVHWWNRFDLHLKVNNDLHKKFVKIKATKNSIFLYTLSIVVCSICNASYLDKILFQYNYYP